MVALSHSDKLVFFVEIVINFVLYVLLSTAGYNIVKEKTYDLNFKLNLNFCRNCK